MRWLGQLPVLAAVVVILIDPFQCADGCTDETAAFNSLATTCCALCQRSVEPAAATQPAPQRLAAADHRTPAFVPVPPGWHPEIDHPPRLH